MSHGAQSARARKKWKPAISKPAMRKAPRRAPADPRRLIHERTRLAIMSALAVNPGLTFNELKALLGVSDGNLSVHARKLEDAKLIQCKKSFANRVPRTLFRITKTGRATLEEYLTEMERLIRSVRGK